MSLPAAAAARSSRYEDYDGLKRLNDAMTNVDCRARIADGERRRSQTDPVTRRGGYYWVEAGMAFRAFARGDSTVPRAQVWGWLPVSFSVAAPWPELPARVPKNGARRDSVPGTQNTIGDCRIHLFGVMLTFLLGGNAP